MGAGLIEGLATQQDFYMNILMAQLKNQDPEEPMTNAEMVTQLSQLATLDAISQLNVNFGELLKLQRLAQGTDLIGHELEYWQDGQLAYGSVQGVAVRDDSIQLVLGDGGQVSLDDVNRIL